MTTRSESGNGNGRAVRPSTIQWVRVSDMEVDDIQRPASASWVADRVDDFDVEKLGLPVVYRTEGGKYLVIDGQHRVLLMRAVGWGDQRIECEVFHGLSRPERARLFLARNDRRAVSPLDKYLQQVTACDDLALLIDAAVRRAQLRVASNGDGVVRCVSALRQVAEVSGGGAKAGALITRTLGVLSAAWGRAGETYVAGVVVGVAAVLLRYGAKVKDEHLSDRLRATTGGAKTVLLRAKAFAQVSGQQLGDAVAATIVAAYNERKRGQRLDPWVAEVVPAKPRPRPEQVELEVRR